LHMLENTSKFIPEDTIREIRETCSIVEVVSGYVSLKKAGANYQGLCPFHNEKTPSFTVNESKKFFYCFGCGASGDVFSFLMKHDKISFQEAARLLAKKYGIHLPEKPLSPRQQKRLSEKEQLYKANQAAADLYHRLLVQDSRAKQALQYLQERGITGETIREYRLGFAPDAWDTLTHQLDHKSRLHAGKTGLLIDKGTGRYYDRFRNRIIFPISSVSNHIVGFGGRSIGPGEPKYLNSPESAVYSKRHNLYGLHTAVRHIQKENRVLIVEGYLDVLTLHQAGAKNAVAALGTALTEHQIRILNRYTPNIVTVFDSDPSGVKAMVRSLEPFLMSAVSPRVVLLPPGEDPDSFVRSNGIGPFRDQIDKAELLLDFVIEKTVEKNDLATPNGKVRACNDTVPLLRKISDSLERDLYIQKISRRIGVGEAHIRSRIGAQPRHARPDDGPERQQKEKPAYAPQNAEKIIVHLMILHTETIDIIQDKALLEDFTNDDLRTLGTLLCRIYREQGTLSIPYLMDTITEERWKQLIAEDALRNETSGSPVKILEDCIRSIRLKKNSRQREKINLLLKQAEANRDESLSLRYQHEFQTLLHEKRDIMQFKLNFHQT